MGCVLLKFMMTVMTSESFSRKSSPGSSYWLMFKSVSIWILCIWCSMKFSSVYLCQSAMRSLSLPSSHLQYVQRFKMALPFYYTIYLHWHVEGIENTNTRETENKNCQCIPLPHHSLYKGPFCTYVTFWDFLFSIIDCQHSHVIACSPKHDFQRVMLSIIV